MFITVLLLGTAAMLTMLLGAAAIPASGSSAPDKLPNDPVHVVAAAVAVAASCDCHPNLWVLFAWQAAKQTRHAGA